MNCEPEAVNVLLCRAGALVVAGMISCLAGQGLGPRALGRALHRLGCVGAGQPSLPLWPGRTSWRSGGRCSYSRTADIISLIEPLSLPLHGPRQLRVQTPGDALRVAARQPRPESSRTEPSRVRFASVTPTLAAGRPAKGGAAEQSQSQRQRRH